MFFPHKSNLSPRLMSLQRREQRWRRTEETNANLEGDQMGNLQDMKMFDLSGKDGEVNRWCVDWRMCWLWRIYCFTCEVVSFRMYLRNYLPFTSWILEVQYNLATAGDFLIASPMNDHVELKHHQFFHNVGLYGGLYGLIIGFQNNNYLLNAVCWWCLRYYMSIW